MPQSPHFSNLLLASLPPENTAALVPHLRVVQLPQETVLFAGDTIKAIYFPHTGIVSIVVDLASGEMIETAMIGRDSLVGGSAAVDDDIALNRAVVKVAAVASVVDVGAFRRLAQQSHTLHATLARHRQFILAQAQQSAAACHAAHTLEARLSRSLLRCHDLLGSDDIPLTQEFLAEMLGVRRTSVTVVASTLQQAGFIRYRRGHIRVIDVEGLRESACECYETIKLQGKRLLGTPVEESVG
jgi:CRP-like cAMP-binding protein